MNSNFNCKIKFTNPEFENALICGCSKISNEKLNGRGILIDKKTNNMIYEGEWSNNKKQGIGILYNKFGNLEYDGEWVDDMKNGTGIEYYPNNELNSNIFFHSTEKNNKDKLEKFYKNCKIKYYGNFEKNMYSGIGKLYNKRGRIIYDGIWYENQKHGQGIEYNDVGKKVYEGKWVLNEKKKKDL